MNEPCTNIQELLPWLLNGTLSSEETVTTLNHVMGCTVCKQELAFLATTQDAAVNTWQWEPDPTFSDELWSRIQEETQREDANTSQQPASWGTATVTALRHAFFPLSPAYDALRFVYRTVATRIIPILN